MNRLTMHFVVVASLLLALPAQAQVQWNPSSYIDLVREGDRLYEEAGGIPDDRREERRSLLYQSAQVKQRALEMIRRGLLSGSVAGDLRAIAIEDLFNLNENIIVIMMDLDQCAAAELLLEQALGDPTILPVGAVEHLESQRPRIRACESRVAVAPDMVNREAMAEVTQDRDRYRAELEDSQASETALQQELQRTEEELAQARAGSSPAPASGTDPLPYALLAGGGALLVSALVVDLALAGERDDLDRLQSECNAGPCNLEHARATADTLDDGKVAIGVLLGAGLVSATVGTILLLTGDDDDGGESTALAPRVGPDSFGLVFTMQHF